MKKARRSAFARQDGRCIHTEGCRLPFSHLPVPSLWSPPPPCLVVEVVTLPLAPVRPCEQVLAVVGGGCWGHRLPPAQPTAHMNHTRTTLRAWPRRRRGAVSFGGGISLPPSPPPPPSTPAKSTIRASAWRWVPSH